jgi:uncharacterized protein
MRDPRHERVILTGASRGIGRAMATSLARRGYEHLVLVARSGDELHEVARSLPVRCSVHCCDLADPSQVEELIQAFPTTDVLINNAGIGVYGHFHDQPWRAHQRLLALNVVALTRLCHHYTASMWERGHGRILNVGSTCGLGYTPLLSDYTGSKAYVIQFSKSLAMEMAGRDVKVSVLLPGPTATRFCEVAGFPPQVKSKRHIAADPHDVAEFGVRLMEAGSLSGIPGARSNVVQLAKLLAPDVIWSKLVRRRANGAIAAGGSDPRRDGVSPKTSTASHPAAHPYPRRVPASTRR